MTKFWSTFETTGIGLLKITLSSDCWFGLTVKNTVLFISGCGYSLGVSNKSKKFGFLHWYKPKYKYKNKSIF